MKKSLKPAALTELAATFFQKEMVLPFIAEAVMGEIEIGKVAIEEKEIAPFHAREGSIPINKNNK